MYANFSILIEMDIKTIQTTVGFTDTFCSCPDLFLIIPCFLFWFSSFVCFQQLLCVMLMFS